MDNFQYIDNRSKFADFLGIPLSELTYVLYIKKVETFYATFEISKKSGGTRSISAPTGDLKVIQRKLAKKLWEHQKSIWELEGRVPNISHAFEKNKSIITNARIHRNKRIILNLDLENFFGSFHFGRVKGYFHKNKYFAFPESIATIIAQLTCYNKSLPQGAPSSPIITNLICKILDSHLLGIARKFHVTYTRYADDLTFSTNDIKFIDSYEKMIAEISKEVNRAGFLLNQKKTRLQLQSMRQDVTGLVVNRKVNVKKEFYKQTRAMANNLYKNGEFEIAPQSVGNLNQLEGRFTFINQLEHYNNKNDGLKHDFYSLSAREQQYQQFLFYKYFFSNNKALIITEGKTDRLYLQSALKKLWNEYPGLITKKSDGRFEYNISFLKRTKIMQYLFGIFPDGADTIKKIYAFFIHKNGYSRNYLQYFETISQGIPLNPVIFLFDNETNKKNKKPLSSFANYACLSTSQRDELQETLSFHLQTNLYLLTTPLYDGRHESEIEDLFDSNILNLKIAGKSFCRSDKSSSEKSYGKHIFSQYISDHYEEINFDKFRPLLDRLSMIVREYQSK
jgi:hypothetical protein